MIPKRVKLITEFPAGMFELQDWLDDASAHALIISKIKFRDVDEVPTGPHHPHFQRTFADTVNFLGGQVLNYGWALENDEDAVLLTIRVLPESDEPVEIPD
jgi:hypothetical protein